MTYNIKCLSQVLFTRENQALKSDPYALYTPTRPVGRPKLRWDDALTNFFHEYFPDNYESHWIDLLASSDCTDLEESFIAYVVKS